jgi:alkylation response protein AidB-like acyl-CoA dehydrogenase
MSRFTAIFDEIRSRAAQREADRELPFDEVRLLKEAGFGALRLPASDGGSGLDIPELFALLVELGEADPNQPQIWRNHFAFVEDRLLAGPAEHNRRWLGEVASGAFIGGAWSENPLAPGEKVGTRLIRTDDGATVRGTKFYSTGTIYSDWISVFAQGANDENLIVIVDTTLPEVEILDDWTGIGQRLTGSGTTHFHDVPVDSSSIYPFEQRALYQESFYQLILLSALVGVGRSLRSDLVKAVIARKRNYAHGLSTVPREDPQLQEVVGRVSALVSSAEASVQRAAIAIQLAYEHARDGLDDKPAATAAAVATYEAQLTVSDSILAATTLLYDALGSSAVVSAPQLDRHWRNARTLSSHNPRVYKARIIGDYYLNDASPLSVYEDAVAKQAVAAAG